MTSLPLRSCLFSRVALRGLALLATLTAGTGAFAQSPPLPPAAQPQPPAAPPQPPPPPQPPGAQPQPGPPAQPPGAPQPPPPAPPPGYAPPGYAPPGYPPPGYAPPGYAQPPYGYPPYPPPYGYAPYVSPQGYPPPDAPRPAPKRGVHLHDGFYLRMGLGLGFHRSTTKVSSPTGVLEASADIRGTGPAIDFAIGGVLGAGFAIAGDLGGHSATNPSSSQSSLLTYERVSYTRLGVLLDWYPVPTGGFHVQGGLASATYTYRVGLAAGALGNTSFYGDASMSGLGWNLGAGYEGWVGEQWAIGGLFRLDGASLKGGFNDQSKATVLTPSILFTATFN